MGAFLISCWCLIAVFLAIIGCNLRAIACYMACSERLREGHLEAAESLKRQGDKWSWPADHTLGVLDEMWKRLHRGSP